MADMMISFAKKGIEHTNNLKKKALSQGTKRKGSIDPFSSVVPPLVEDIVKFIEEYGMVEGLFRTVGNKKDIQLILSSYGKGKRLDLSKFGPHTCASALKQYLANLTEPILTNELLTCFMLAIEVKLPDGEKERASLVPNLHSIKSAVDLLPPGNKEVLSRICHMLRTISQSSSCKLGVTELAVALSPLIFPKEHSNVVKYIEDSQKAHSLVETFINRYPVIFLNESPVDLETNKNNKFMLKLHRSSMRLGNNLQLRLQKLKEEKEDEEEEEEVAFSKFGSSDYMITKLQSKEILTLSTIVWREWIFSALFIIISFIPAFLSFILWRIVLSACLLYITYKNMPESEVCVVNRNDGTINIEKRLFGKIKSVRVHQLAELNDVIVEKNKKKKGAYRTVLLFESGIAVPLTDSYYFHPRGIKEKEVATQILNFVKADK